jgi:hypothetical protein
MFIGPLPNIQLLREEVIPAIKYRGVRTIRTFHLYLATSSRLVMEINIMRPGKESGLLPGKTKVDTFRRHIQSKSDCGNISFGVRAGSTFTRDFCWWNVICYETPDDLRTFHIPESIHCDRLGCRGQRHPSVRPKKNSVLSLTKDFCLPGRNSLYWPVRLFAGSAGIVCDGLWPLRLHFDFPLFAAFDFDFDFAFHFPFNFVLISLSHRIRI